MDYEEALEKARAAYGTGAYDDATLEFIFPQIKESEDEKRKRAVAVLEQQRYYWASDGPADKTPPATKRKDLVEAIDVALSYLEKQKEQKPAEWSEEDDEYRNGIIRDLEYLLDMTAEGWVARDLRQRIEWLKSLRPQPKQEWSGVDDLRLHQTIDVCDRNGYPILSRWLKGLPRRVTPQTHWKPSEEHLSALLAVFNDPNNIGSQTCQLALTDLYNQLKKIIEQ